MMNNIEQGIQKRQQILDFIVFYIEQHGYAPTVREIGEGVSLKSTSSVHAHLLKMANEGLIETDAGFGVPRAIRVTGYGFVKNADSKKHIAKRVTHIEQGAFAEWGRCPSCGQKLEWSD